MFSNVGHVLSQCNTRLRFPNLLNKAYKYDVTAAMLVSPNKEKAVKLLSQTDPSAIKFYAYVYVKNMAADQVSE